MTRNDPIETPTNHLPWLDWCRFLGAFAVMLVHSRAYAFASYGAIDLDQHHPITAAFYVATRIGTQGVLIFFVLSGFLVGGKTIERFRDGSFRVGNYVIDRCSRILVPFFPALALTVVIAHFTGHEKFSYGSLTGNLFFLQGIAVKAYPGNEPLWSLSYEVWFYILAGSCAMLGVSVKSKPVGLFVATISLLVFTVLKPIYLFCWIIGALAWVGRPPQKSTGSLSIGILLLIYGMMGVQVFSEAQTASINAAFSRYNGFFISYEAAQIAFCAGCALIVQQLILRQPSGSMAVRLERAGTRLAAFSYTLYLIHNPLLQWFHSMGLQRATRFTPNSIGLFLGIISSCMVLSWLFYLLFEKHTRSIRRRLQHLAG